MRKIISCVIGIALLFTSIFPGNLIDYKINTETQGNKVMINEELLYGGKDIEELKAIIPETYETLVVNSNEYHNINSVNLNELNEICILYEKDSFSIENREQVLENYIVGIKQPRENRYISIVKSVILSPTLILYSGMIIGTIIYGVIDHNLFTPADGFAELTIYFAIIELILVIKTIIHEQLKNRLNYSVNDQTLKINGRNRCNENMLLQYRNGYNKGLKYLKMLNNDGIKYNQTQKRDLLFMHINHLGLSILLPLLSYGLFNVLNLNSDDAWGDLILYIIGPAIFSLLDIICYSIYSISHMIQMKKNRNLKILQAYKVIYEQENNSRAFIYGFKKAIQKDAISVEGK